MLQFYLASGKILTVCLTYVLAFYVCGILSDILSDRLSDIYVISSEILFGILSDTSS